MFVIGSSLHGLGTSYPTANPTPPLIQSAHVRSRSSNLKIYRYLSQYVSLPTLQKRGQFNRPSNTQACEKPNHKTFGSFQFLLKPALLCTTRTDKALKPSETVRAALPMRLWINGLKLKFYCLITWKRSITWCPLQTETQKVHQTVHFS